jgi:hypothetical protein
LPGPRSIAAPEQFVRFKPERPRQPPKVLKVDISRARLDAFDPAPVQAGQLGELPPALAAGFTTGELAVLRILAEAHGVCDRSLNELAARAGVCRSLAI